MSSRRTLARVACATGATAALTLGLAAPASAHVTVTPSETAAGAYTVLTFSNGHGCDGSPTTGIRIQIPDGINAVTPTRQDFYDVTKQAEKLDPPVTDAHGNELTERVDTVTYTAKTNLPDGFRDAFEISLQIPEDAEGEKLVFPVIQSCVQGETAWTEVAAEGQSEDDLESPAPYFEVTAPGEDAHGDDAAEDEAADSVSVTEASGEPEDAAAESDDDGNGLAIAGLVAGVAGLLVGGLALARGRKTA